MPAAPCARAFARERLTSHSMLNNASPLAPAPPRDGATLARAAMQEA